MLSRNNKLEIINNISKMTSVEIIELKRIVNYTTESYVYNKHYISSYVGRKYSTRKKYDGYYLRKALYLEIFNDAPKGGQDGDFVVLANNKSNREKVSFIKEFLEIY